MNIETKIDDGTEHRQVTLRLREGGIKEILEGLSEYGFCSTGTGRLTRTEEELLFDFCFNVGRYDTKVLALSVTIIIPLSDKEKKFVPVQVDEEEKEKETDEEPPADAADVDPGLST